MTNVSEYVILYVNTKLAKGCKIKQIQPQGVTSLKTNADAFIDNATLLHNTCKFNTRAQELMLQVQHNASIWSRLLWVTGGLLEFLKSSYFLMIWNFTEEGKPYIVEEKNLPVNNVQLIDAAGTATKLKRYAPTKGIKMLGSHKAATLQETTEFDYIHTKGEKFLKALLSC